MKKAYSTSDAPGAPQFLSQIIESNGLLFVAGQIHVLPDNTLVEGSVAQKIEQIMKNIEAILVTANSSLKNIVKVVIYVTDMTQLPEINEVYPKYFIEPFPVREAVCVSSLPLKASIEFSVIAEK